MRIDRASKLEPGGGLQGAGKAPPQGGPAFAALLQETAGTGEASQLAALEATQVPLLASAADADGAQAEAMDRRARRHGRAMLRALGALQLAMLDSAAAHAGGDAEEAARAHLAALAHEAPQAEDPVLRLILREIAARAAAELARGVAPGQIISAS